MKKKIDGIVVVEGKTDVDFLSAYLDAEFVVTNGSAISEDTIKYLKNTKQTIYVLTDPDFPGKKIRDELSNNTPNLKHVFIKKENSIKHGKVGVAEGNIDEILEAFEHAYTDKKEDKGNIQMCDLISLGLVGNDGSSVLRNKICDHFHLGFCNAKTFLKRVNNNKISFEELEEYAR